MENCYKKACTAKNIQSEFLIFWFLLSAILPKTTGTDEADFGYKPLGPTNIRMMENNPSYFKNFPTIMLPNSTVKTYTATQVVVTASHTGLEDEALKLF